MAVFVTDSEETFRVSIARGVLTQRRMDPPFECDLRLSIAKVDFANLASGTITVENLRAQGSIECQGDIASFETLMSLMDHFDGEGGLSTPRLRVHG